jgi:hypothetical protein
MRPQNWNPPVELSVAETHVVKRIRKAKLFAFLRAIRHKLFNDEFQAELAILFKDSSVSRPKTSARALRCCLQQIALE